MFHTGLAVLDEVGRNYLAGRYQPLLERALELLNQPTPFEVWLLVIIAGQRVDQAIGPGSFSMADFLAGQIEPRVRGQPELHALLRLARGQIGREQALGVSDCPNFRNRCEYHAAAALYTAGEPVAAVRLLERCVKQRAATFEAILARNELAGGLWKFHGRSRPEVFHGIPAQIETIGSQIRAGQREGAGARARALFDQLVRLSNSEPPLERAMACSDLAGLERILGEPARAVTLLDHAVELLSPLESEYPGTLLGLLEKRLTLELRPPGEDCRDLSQRAVSLFESIQPDSDTEERAERLEQLAHDAAERNRPDEASAAVARAIALREACEDRPNMADTLEPRRFLVGSLLAAGHTEKASSAALELARRSVGAASVAPSQQLDDLTLVLRLARARALEPSDLDWFRDTLAPFWATESPTADRARFHLAVQFQQRRRHWDALALLHREPSTLSTSDLACWSFTRAGSLLHVNDLASAQAAIDRARHLFDQAGSPAESDQKRHLNILEAEIAYHKGDSGRGDGLLRAAIESRADGQPDVHALNVLLGHYGPRGHDAVLGPLLAREVERSQGSLALTANTHPHWNNVARAAMGAGQLELAASLFERMFSATDLDAAPDPELAVPAMNFARLHLLKGDVRAAHGWIRRSLAAQDQELAAMPVAASNRQRALFLDQARESLDTYLSFALDHAPGLVDPAELWGAVLRRKGIDLEILARAARLPRNPGTDRAAHVLRELGRLNDARTQAAWNTLGHEQPGLDQIELESQIDRLESEWAALAGSPGLDWLAVRPDDVLDRLAPDAVLIELVRYRAYDFTRVRNCWGGWRYARIVARGADRLVSATTLGPAEHIDGQVDNLIQAVKARGTSDRQMGQRAAGGGSSWAEPARALHTALIEPIADHLDSVRTLVIAPDGRPSLLPFELLQDGAGNLLIDRFAIEYANSGRELALRASRPERSASTPGLVVAAPDFELQSGTGEPDPCAPDSAVVFAPLEGAAREGERVARLLGCRCWSGAEALDGRIKQVVSPAVLHVATHGYFDGGDAPSRVRAAQRLLPFDAALALAGASTFLRGGSLPPEAEDGFLFAEEIAALDLSGTDLVVLSACESGVGRPLPGQGITGLRRALMAAGARTLVVALWPVPDEPTAHFMEEFYRGLVDGLACAAALSRARAAMRTTAPATPALWAGFVCLGDPRTRLQPAWGAQTDRPL